jgi:hypothetical protein
MATKLRLEGHLLIFKRHKLLSRFQCDMHLQQLLGYDRQYLNKNSVELIKAGPAALLSETGEEFAHHLVIYLI